MHKISYYISGTWEVTEVMHFKQPDLISMIMPTFINQWTFLESVIYSVLAQIYLMMNRSNMILALEQEFGIRYDGEQVVSMLSVGEIIDATKGMLGLQ